MKAIFLKRPFDVTLSLLGIIVSLPLWLLFAFLVWVEDREPVFYKQKRVGKNGRLFKALKFRSMIKDAEKGVGPIQAEEDDPRVTRIGKILRATAMDELPQLINILKGDMSFVGPRALRPEEIEVESYERELRNWEAEERNQKLESRNAESDIRNQKAGKEKQKFENVNWKGMEALEEVPGYYERQRVRPGLTGIAQIYLPTDAPRRKKFRYDLLYIKKQSFWLDLKLIFLSFWVTLRGKWESRQRKI